MPDKIGKYSVKSDPRGLIFEAYNMPDITFTDCRSIFFDWALSITEDFNTSDEIKKLYNLYSVDYKTHPMTLVLLEGLEGAPSAQRRRRRIKSTNY